MIIENDSNRQMIFLMEDGDAPIQIPIDGQNANYEACNRSHLSRN